MCLELGITAWTAWLVAPVVDLSVVGLLAGMRYLSLHGYTGAQLRRHDRDPKGDHRARPGVVALTSHFVKSMLSGSNTMLARTLELAFCGEPMSGSGGTCSSVGTSDLDAHRIWALGGDAIPELLLPCTAVSSETV